MQNKSISTPMFKAISLCTKSSGYKSIGTSPSPWNTNSMSEPFVPSHIKPPQSLASKSLSSLHEPKTLAAVSFKPLSLAAAFKPNAMDVDTNTEITVPPSRALAPANASFNAKFLNEMNSFSVANGDCTAVMRSFASFLNSLPRDTHFSADYSQRKMDGMCFVSNTAVHFALYFWAEPLDANMTRIEYRRTSGDALASATFWSQIKAFFGGEKVDSALHTESMDLMLQKSFSRRELADIARSVDENEIYAVDELNYLCACLLAADSESIAVGIAQSEELVTALTRSALRHRDVSISRAALKIFLKLAEMRLLVANEMLCEGIRALAGDRRRFIQRMSNALLSELRACTKIN